MVGRLALLSCPQGKYALPLKWEEFQPNRPDGRKPRGDAADYLDALIASLTICISFLD